MLGQLFSRPETTPLPDDLLPKNVESLYVTIYIEGRLRGCMGLAVRNLDDDLKEIVEAALRDERFLRTAASMPIRSRLPFRCFLIRSMRTVAAGRSG